MKASKSLFNASLSPFQRPKTHFPLNPKPFSLLPLRFPYLSLEIGLHGVRTRPYSSVQGAISLDSAEFEEGSERNNTVEQLLKNQNDEVSKLMKMERQTTKSSAAVDGGGVRWFPYADKFRCINGVCLTSGEVLEAVGPHIMEGRTERFRKAVENRSYSVCLVVEGLSDFGNVSAAFRSADALGFQSVHVVSCDSSKRYRENRHVSMGAEKWLDIELWDSTPQCFEVLKSRGYRIATTHVGIDTVSIYDMDWSCPTAIVVGNENRGITDEALKMSDLHCSIPMKGMVDSFNVSVAAGILMHQAVCDRISRLGHHGDLTLQEKQILLAEFSLRHSRSTISIAHEYGRRKAAIPIPKLWNHRGWVEPEPRVIIWRQSSSDFLHIHTPNRHSLPQRLHGTSSARTWPESQQIKTRSNCYRFNFNSLPLLRISAGFHLQINHSGIALAEA